MTLPIVTVTVGPSSTSVAQRATVKSDLGIAASDTSEDTKIDRIIQAVGQAFAGPEGLQRPPWRQTYSEQRPGGGGIYLPLSRWPVESVTSVTLESDTVAASSYSIAEPERSKLYASDGWHDTVVNTPLGERGSGDEDVDYTVVYVAGWLMPGEVPEWAASTAVSGSGWMRSTSASDLFIFQADAAGGTTGGSEPTWPTTEDGTVVDNDITWTAKPAQELPFDIREAALMTAVEWLRGGLQVPQGVAEEAFDGVRVKYRERMTGALPEYARRVLRAYR